VSTASENGAGSLRRSATERARRGRGEVMHGVGMCGGRVESWTDAKEVGRRKKKKERKEIRGRAAPSCLSLYLAHAYVRFKKHLTPYNISLYPKAVKAC